MKKGEMSIKTIIISVIAVLIMIAFIPIFVSTITETQAIDSTANIFGENVTFVSGTPNSLANAPLVVNETAVVIAYNATDNTRFNETQTRGFVVLFRDNSTINMTGGQSGKIGFNYTYHSQNATGISASSILLLSFILFIFVAGIIVVVVKKFLQ